MKMQDSGMLIRLFNVRKTQFGRRYGKYAA